MLDAELLSRLQFAMNIMFHYIFPPLSIGLSLLLVIFELRFIQCKDPIYKQMSRFWTKVFALTFSLGVATGLVMIFAFGTNWARFSIFVGDVFGSILGAEGVFAFTAESGFLGIMLFGWNRVSNGVHFFATLMVCLASHFSALWIVIANSWMQTPAGYKIVGEGANKHAVMTDIWEVMTNASAGDRIVHVYLACWLTGSFFTISVSAYYLLKKRHIPFAMKTMKISLIVATIAILLQGISGDSTARGVAVNQPIKLAAMEGVFETKPYTDINIFGVVNEKDETIDYQIAIPGMLSFLCFHDFETPVPGLNQFPKEDWPNVPAVFQVYHIMIAMFGLMFMLVAVSIYLWRKKRLANSKWVLRALIVSCLFPQIANQAGWATAEMGRQPWLVYGVLRRADGFTTTVPVSHMLMSLIMFALIYLCLFALFVFILNRKVQHGPEDLPEDLYRDYLK